MKRPPLETVCRKIASRSAADLRADAPRDARCIWNAEFFGLHRSRFWRSANEAAREALLRRCTSNLLREALGIERQAMDYCARRVLKAASLLEKQVYCLLAAEEARHYHWLGSLLPETATADSPDAFACFLARLVMEGTPLAQSYLLQIILEGWGVSHYQRLAAASLDPAVGRVMSGIARDEVLHYAAGVAHFDAALLTQDERDFIRTALAELCTMLASGPLAVLRETEIAAGGFAPAERKQALEDLTDASLSVARLERLARFVAHKGMAEEAAWVRDRGLLTPFASEASLRLYEVV